MDPADHTALVADHDDDDVVQALEPFGSLEDDHHTEDDTSAMIAEATAAAIASATAVDVVAVDAAALAAESAANLVDAAGVPVVSVHASNSDRKNEQRRKRYRERLLEEEDYDEETGEAKPRHRTEGAPQADQLASRRARDRERYANMTPEEREAYNARRRKQYQKQNEKIRQRRRERERNRYHNLSEEETKERNAKRAELERQRYKKLSREALEERNRKRRERAAAQRQKKMKEVAEAASVTCASIEFQGQHGQEEHPVTANCEDNDLLVDMSQSRRLVPQHLQHFGSQQNHSGSNLGENSLQDIWKEHADL